MAWAAIVDGASTGNRHDFGTAEAVADEGAAAGELEAGSRWHAARHETTSTPMNSEPRPARVKPRLRISRMALETIRGKSGNRVQFVGV